MYTVCLPLFGNFVSKNCMYSNSEMKIKHNKIIRMVDSRPIKNENVLINDITKISNIYSQSSEYFKINLYYNIFHKTFNYLSYQLPGL